MKSKHKKLLSAEVILRSKSGKEPSADAVITAETLHEYEPSSTAVLESQRRLNALGFQVTPLVGISFSITAAQDVFEQVFKVTLRQNQKGSVEIVKNNRAAGNELPLEKLPKDLQAYVYAVTFVPPPDFGPEDFFR